MYPIVVLLLDGLGDRAHESLGGRTANEAAETPNLDAFAATCVRFEHCHLAAPICQPSRSAIMTGRVPHRSGALGFHPIKAGTPTLITLLRNAGWFAAVIDKHPHMMPEKAFPWDLKFSGAGKNPKQFGECVAQSIKAAKDAKKPLFLNANITDPHRPFAHSEQEEKQKAKKPKKGGNTGPVQAYKPEEITVPSFLEDIPDVRREVAQYYTSVRRFDLSFGELMAALREAGLDETNTLVIFLSDHGMSFPFSKATVYRNGTWSPVLMRWPGMGEPQRREEFVSSVDILPTLFDALKLQPLNEIDGRSWLPILRGEKQDGRDFVITHVNTVSSGKSFAQRCIRTKDFSYQFHAWPDGTPHFRVEAMNGLSYQAMAKAGESNAKIKARVQQLVVGTPQQFFDLRSDPDERVNLVGDAKQRMEILRLQRLLLSHMERTGDPQLENFRKVLETK